MFQLINYWRTVSTGICSDVQILNTDNALLKTNIGEHEFHFAIEVAVMSPFTHKKTLK